MRNSEEMAYGFINEKHKDIAMAVISTVAKFLFGEFNLVMQYLFAANIIDIFTGIFGGIETVIILSLYHQ